MTTVKIINSGYTSIVHVEQRKEDIIELSTNAESLGSEHVLSYSPYTENHCQKATDKYHPDKGIVEFHGGRFHIGFGASLGWETTAQIGKLRFLRILEHSA